MAFSSTGRAGLKTRNYGGAGVKTRNYGGAGVKSRNYGGTPCPAADLHPIDVPCDATM